MTDAAAKFPPLCPGSTSTTLPSSTPEPVRRNRPGPPPGEWCSLGGTVAAAAATAGASAVAGAAGVAAGLGRGGIAGWLADGVRAAALSWWLAGATPHPASPIAAAATIQVARCIRRRG